jgi:hypothetical protein
MIKGMDYRISHYNESNKSTQWTSVSDVVNENNFEETFEEYKATENKYINILKYLLDKNGIIKMKIYELENNMVFENGIVEKLFDKNIFDELKIKNGNEYLVKDIVYIIRLCLREIIWCKIVWENIYIHIGYDYYVYIGGLKIDKDYMENELKNGITIEEYKSPYLEINV